MICRQSDIELLAVNDSLLHSDNPSIMDYIRLKHDMLELEKQVGTHLSGTLAELWLCPVATITLHTLC
jgi:hypothetical protein